MEITDGNYNDLPQIASMKAYLLYGQREIFECGILLYLAGGQQWILFIPGLRLSQWLLLESLLHLLLDCECFRDREPFN